MMLGYNTEFQAAVHSIRDSACPMYFYSTIQCIIFNGTYSQVSKFRIAALDMLNTRLFLDIYLFKAKVNATFQWGRPEFFLMKAGERLSRTGTARGWALILILF